MAKKRKTTKKRSKTTSYMMVIRVRVPVKDAKDTVVGKVWGYTSNPRRPPFDSKS